MANISSLEMAKTITDNTNIEIVKSFWGLGKKLVYKPTQSKVNLSIKCFTPEVEHSVMALLSTPAKALADAAKRLGPKIKAVDVSSCRLEACVSADRQFAAYQLFRYVDFGFQPISDVVTFEGEAAQIVTNIL